MVHPQEYLDVKDLPFGKTYRRSIVAFTGGLVCSAVLMLMSLLSFLTAIYEGFARLVKRLPIKT
jgi:hypothetical protein